MNGEVHTLPPQEYSSVGPVIRWAVEDVLELHNWYQTTNEALQKRFQDLCDEAQRLLKELYADESPGHLAVDVALHEIKRFERRCNRLLTANRWLMWSLEQEPRIQLTG